VSEIRLYVTTTEKQAEQILDLMSEVFGEEDFAIATTEIDEKKDIWEASVYMMTADEADVRARVEAALRLSFPEATLEREVIPDIDWVSKSLEGLKPVRAGRFLIHGAHDRDRRRPNDIAIEIEAGEAFGTGHHGTTAGCLATRARSGTPSTSAPGPGCSPSPSRSSGMFPCSPATSILSPRA
jgi:ribosomal protein L11 methyltransferase